MKRRKLRQIRIAAYRGQNGRCYYCNLPIWEVDPEEFATNRSVADGSPDSTALPAAAARVLGTTRPDPDSPAQTRRDNGLSSRGALAPARRVAR